MLNRFLITTATLTLTACAPPFSPSPPPQGAFNPLQQLGIRDARMLVLSNDVQSQGYRTANYAQNLSLYKVDAQGKVSLVEATDTSGKPMSMNLLAPRQLVEVNSEFLLLVTPPGKYLIRRTDGKAARIAEGFGGYGPSHEKLIQTDDLGNFYLVDRGSLLKITTVNMENPDQIGKTTLNKAEVEGVSSFAVDRKGNVLAALTKSQAQYGNWDFRIYRAAGGVNLLPSMHGLPWAGRDGKLYVGGLGSMNSLHHVFFDANGIASASVVTVTQPDPNRHYDLRADAMQHRAELPEQTVIGGTASRWQHDASAGNGSYVDQVALQVVKGLESDLLLVPELQSIKQITASDRHVYVLGMTPSDQTLVLKVDPLKKTRTAFAQNSGMDILRIEANADDRLTFTAVREADGKYVVGEIDPEGQAVVLTTELPPVQQILTLK